jgi:hypothetical protein
MEGENTWRMKDEKRECESKPGILSASIFYFFPEIGCFKRKNFDIG